MGSSSKCAFVHILNVLCGIALFYLFFSFECVFGGKQVTASKFLTTFITFISNIETMAKEDHFKNARGNKQGPLAAARRSSNSAAFMIMYSSNHQPHCVPSF